MQRVNYSCKNFRVPDKYGHLEECKCDVKLRRQRRSFDLYRRVLEKMGLEYTPPMKQEKARE